MKRTCICNTCGTQTTPNKWRALGWIKIEYTFVGGGKARTYTCASCREKNALSVLNPPPQTKAKPCNHKFIDSKSCLKCGWTPSPEQLAALDAPAASLTPTGLSTPAQGCANGATLGATPENPTNPERVEPPVRCFRCHVKMEYCDDRDSDGNLTQRPWWNCPACGHNEPAQ